MSDQHRSWAMRVRRTLVVAGIAGAAAVTAAGPALAAPATGTNLLTNGSLQAPTTGPDTSEGVNPTGWAPANLGADQSPYSATIGHYDSSGQYPPPAGSPEPYASEVYYSVGSTAGLEVFGGQQTSSTFGSITNADDPQVSFATVESSYPSATHASWAGSALEIDFTSGGSSYVLRYFDPFTAGSAAYSSAPSNSATTKYITGPTLTKGTWNVPTTARDLDADVLAQFGLTSFTVNSVTYEDIEQTTANTSPYPNMTAFFADVALDEGSAPSTSLPEAPLAIGLPLAGVAAAGGAVALRRRRRTG